jgi:hypothetical protein
LLGQFVVEGLAVWIGIVHVGAARAIDPGAHRNAKHGPQFFLTAFQASATAAFQKQRDIRLQSWPFQCGTGALDDRFDEQLVIVVRGDKGGRSGTGWHIRGGQQLRFTQGPGEERSWKDLLFGIAQVMGVPDPDGSAVLRSFGYAQKSLAADLG